ncbi:MAG: hypothetical protein ACLFQM_08035 [Fidelibacterota bacterium]
MPIDYHYDNKNNILYETGYGVLALSDFFEYRKKVQTLPLQKNLKILSNYLKASLQFKIHEMQVYARMSENLPIKYGTVKLAICANGHLSYGMARMFSSISEVKGLDIEVFRDLSSAQNWLGIE